MYLFQDLKSHIIDPEKQEYDVWQNNADEEEPTDTLILHVLIMLSCYIVHTSINSHSSYLE